jgi:DNA-binding MarR family transcriptional regulator
MSAPPRLFYLLSLAHRAAQSVAERELADLDISGAQAGALFVIPPQGAATVGDVAEALQLAQSAASTLLQRMEKAGLVERFEDDADRRATRVRLTQSGRGARAEAAKRVARMNAALADGFSASDLAIIARFLEQVSARARAFDTEEDDHVGSSSRRRL